MGCIVLLKGLLVSTLSTNFSICESCVSPAVAAVLFAGIRSVLKDTIHCFIVFFHGASNLNKVALEAAPVGQAAPEADGSATSTVVASKAEPTIGTTLLRFIGPLFLNSVSSSCFSEHDAS